MNLLGKAIAIAAEAFKDKTDRGGQPYILHCLYVMNGVSHLGEDAMIAAVLHDLIEDCPGWNLDLLRGCGFNDNVIYAIRLLTHEEDIEYMDYIKMMSFSPVSTAIKMKDIEHNSMVSRLKGLSKKDFDRLEKYATAYTYLKGDDK
jgi:(p)ppGpp synthase/HD superfamily hydrolase